MSKSRIPSQADIDALHTAFRAACAERDVAQRIYDESDDDNAAWQALRAAKSKVDETYDAVSTARERRGRRS
jgi:hypothetical protein